MKSKPFNFYLGPNKSLYMVHTALLAYHSVPLDALVNGEMREAQDGLVFWEEEDEATFVRFCEYAYTGDYRPGEPDIVLDSSMIGGLSTLEGNKNPNQAGLDPVAPEVEARAKPEAHTDMWTFNRPSSIKKRSNNRLNTRSSDRRRLVDDEFNVADESCDIITEDGMIVRQADTKQSVLWESLKTKRYFTGKIPPPAIPFQPRRNVERCEDYTPVFLSHARMYVFADRWDIERLRILSLHKLQQTLVAFTIYDDARVNDLVYLIRFVYANTPLTPVSPYPATAVTRKAIVDTDEDIVVSNGDHEDGRNTNDDSVNASHHHHHHKPRKETTRKRRNRNHQDELRELVVLYAACYIEKFAPNQAWRSLLEEGGNLPVDLLEKLLSRLD